jgi:NAD+ diphosphatase
VSYVASQPWPMPHSLMIGCTAQALNQDIALDKDELEDCRWFSKAEIKQLLDGNHEHGWTAPLKGAIARFLMAEFAKPAD